MIKALRGAPVYVFLGIAAFLSVFPLYFMVVSATNTSRDVIGARMLPGANLLKNWQVLTSQADVAAAFWHSSVNAVLTTLLTLVLCSAAGYGFEIYHSRGKDRLMGLILLAMMIPLAATMIPLFEMFSKVGLVNSTWAVVLPAVATPLLILMFRQASRSFPHETLEAARIDGLGEFAIFVRIYMPMMKPTYAAATVITFMTAWNNFLWPKVVLVNSRYQTLPMLTSNLSAGYVIDYGVLMLAVLIASLPAMVIFLVLQKAFANGIMGSVR